MEDCLTFNIKIMATWFLAKIRYEKTNEKGLTKKVTEYILVDALSFTEAEARTIENMKAYNTGEFTVTALKIENISELFTSDKECDDKFYKIKVAYITLDEKTAKERRTYSYMLVQSSDTANAEKRLHEGMKGTMADYQVVAVQETSIVDVHPYELEPETEETR